MHYISLINRTAAIEDGSAEWLDRLFELEVLLIIWSYIECGSMLYMLYKTNQYHPNLTCLLKHLVIQYFFSMAARLIQISKMYKADGIVDLREDCVFTIATWIRNWLTFIAFYFAPFVMFERTVATIKIQDYENNQRLYVGYILAMFLHIFCFASAAMFIFQVIPVWYHLFSFVFANIASFFICIANDRCNRKRFTDIALMGRRSTEYSLSQRFQLVENLKTAHLFKRGISFIILFSVSCSSFISAEIVENDPILKNWMHVGFNYTAIVYGVGLPAAMYYYGDMWQTELKRLFYKAKSRIWKRKVTVDVEQYHETCPTKTLRNTKGDDMMPRRENETDIYFSQLNKEWNYVRKMSNGVSV